ncbi:MAG: hypothetical protein HY902_18715 [Deltaproteobacteria bacterium]|nr:hypothetical protein [Deltaproteobacteria bacterium]
MAELYAIAQFLEALSRAKPAKADQGGRGAADTGADSALRWVGREPDSLGKVLPARAGAKAYVAAAASPADHMVVPESAVATAQAVPRPGQSAAPPAAPAPAAATGEVKKPGRPIGGPQPRQDNAPGRPRTVALGAAAPAPVATPAAEPTAGAGASSAAGQPKKPALPGRPRSQPVGELSASPAPAEAPPKAAAAAPSAPAAKPVTKVPAQPAPKARTGRLVDQLDGWMKSNPGPRSREELIQVSIDAGWLNADDAKRVFNMCMSRERELFIRTVDGSTEMYIRRAEALAPSSAPGKVVRRRPSDSGATGGGTPS